MVPHITTILQRFTGEGAMRLQPDAMLAAVGVRLPRRPAPGAVPCGHRCAPDTGGRAPPHPRSRPGAGGPSELTTR
jgi:hypothetical protein